MKLNFMEAYSSREEILAKVASAHVLFHFFLSTYCTQSHEASPHPGFPVVSAAVGRFTGLFNLFKNQEASLVQSAPSPSSSGHFHHPPIEFGSSIISLVHTDTNSEQLLFFLIHHSRDQSQDSPRFRECSATGKQQASKQARRRNVSGGKWGSGCSFNVV